MTHIIESLSGVLILLNAFFSRSIIFGPPGNKKWPLLFFIVNLLCWGYPMYIIKVGVPSSATVEAQNQDLSQARPKPS